MKNSQIFRTESANSGGLATISKSVDRRLALMLQTGLRPAEIAWALEVSIDDIEAQLKILSRQLGGQDSAAGSVSGAGEGGRHSGEAGSQAGEQQSTREPLLERAINVLGERIILAGSTIHLDGISASFRDLVVAAAAQGVEIPYPGLRPLPAAFHTGPSELGGRRRKKSASSHLSIHVPY